MHCAFLLGTMKEQRLMVDPRPPHCSHKAKPVISNMPLPQLEVVITALNAFVAAGNWALSILIL